MIPKRPGLFYAMTEILNPYRVTDLYHEVRPAPDICFQL
jgi:hypothetical protein